MKCLSIEILICIMGLFVIKTSAQEKMFYQPEQMHRDLEKFKTALIKIHPGTFTHQSPEEFEEQFDMLKLETSKPLPVTTFYRTVLKLIAGIHDGHTQAYTFGKLGTITNNQERLPFQVHIQDQRIFVVKNLSSKDIPEGSEILAINGKLSNKILSEVLLHYSSDGQSNSGILHWLGRPYRPLYRIYPEIFGEQSSHNLVYRNYNTNEVVSINIGAISKENYESIEETKYPTSKNQEEAFDLSIHKSENYAYMKISRFIKDGFDEPENTYPDFYKKSFMEISNANVQNLVIDLRDNGGGKASNAAYLLQYFIDEPITPAKEIQTLGNDSYFLGITGDTLNLDSSFGLIKKNDGTYKVSKSEVLRDLMKYDPIGQYGFSGKLIVLVSGGTASAGAVAAGLLREHTKAVVVGQETYGYAGISNGVHQISIKGDHTETAIYLPLLHAEYAMDEHIQKRSVVPDHQISNSIQDILENNDAVLEFVLNDLLSSKR